MINLIRTLVNETSIFCNKFYNTCTESFKGVEKMADKSDDYKQNDPFAFPKRVEQIDTDATLLRIKRG